MSNCFIAVEGPQDVEFVAGLLEPEGFQKVVRVDDLDETFGKRLINTKFPHEGDLHKRVPNPMFLRRDSRWIAVQAAGGETPQLAKLVRKVMIALQPFPGALAAIGVVRDADQHTAESRVVEFRKEMLAAPVVSGRSVVWPDAPAQVTPSTPRFGIYILPDNTNIGTLDDLLLTCGDLVYPDLIDGARRFVQGVNLELLLKDDKRLIEKPSGRKKAVAACAASILKPGMSIAVSIDQNRWLTEQTRELPQVRSLSQFLKDLCELT